MNRTEKQKTIALLVVLLCVATVLQCIVFFAIAAEKRENRRQDALLYGQSLAGAIRMTLEKSVDSSVALKYFYMVYGEDCFADFERIAAPIAAENPAIGSLYLAPEGVIRLAYPKEVNEATIGFAMLEDPEQGPRAWLAVNTGRVTVAGPHALVEGGKGLIIRNPLFEGGEFLGFTIVVLDWDRFVEQVLANTSSTAEKYKFAVWKQDHDETAVTDADGYILRNTEESVSKDLDIEFSVPNDTWHLVVEPVGGWAVYNEMEGQIAISVIISLALIMLCVALYSFEQKRLQLNEQIRLNEEKEGYMARLSEALKAAEDANAAKTNFLNNMSHDIRTPMNAVLGFTALMEKELDRPEQLREYLEKIRISGEYLLTLINNMLEVARIDSGKERVDENFVDLTDEDCSVAPMLENEMRAKNLRFSQEMHIEHRYVLADLQKIREITMNLMSNAIKYTPEGGSIHLRFEEIPCEREGWAAYVNTVTDTGIGMAPEFLEHIFDSFSRERNSTESRVMGTGLGMSIVKKLVDLMGGTIEVESEPGKGSTFRVYLTHRIVEEPEQYLAEQHGAIAGETVDLAGKRILLAEDNDLNAEIAAAILEELGAATERAEDGVACVNLLTEREAGYYDLILMDIQMPNLNGYGAARAIRALPDPRKAGIPILAMTANAFEEDRRNAIAAGMNGHLAKPLEIPKLLTALAEVLGQAAP